MTIVWDAKNGVWETNKAVTADVESFEVPKPLWIFGYGSLCWKADDFEFEEKRIAVLKGWKRRFYQRSCDHRGTPENPGLVVTVEKTEEEVDEVVGVAYKIGREHVEETLEKLDFREKGGYSRHIVTIILKGSKALFQTGVLHIPNGNSDKDVVEGAENVVRLQNGFSSCVDEDCICVKGLVYSGTKENPNYAASEIRESPELMSEIIYKSQGPSGKNKDYLFKLAEFIRSIELVDEHVFDLEQRVKNLESYEPQSGVHADDDDCDDDE